MTNTSDSDSYAHSTGPRTCEFVTDGGVDVISVESTSEATSDEDESEGDTVLMNTDGIAETGEIPDDDPLASDPSETETSRKTVYALRLEDGHYYVGVSGSPEERITAHFNGYGSAWTQEHHPTEVVYRSDGVENPDEAERDLTLLLMQTAGWENVRGAAWTQRDRDKPPEPLSDRA